MSKARGRERCGIGEEGKRSAGLETGGKGEVRCGIGAKGKRSAGLKEHCA